MKTFFAVTLAWAVAVLGRPALRRPPPTGTVRPRASPSVITPQGTIVGSSLLGVETFGGIPFAEPPTGSLRLKPPVRLNSSLGTFDASGMGPACPQMYFSTTGELLTSVLGDLVDTPLFQTVSDETEDCLTMLVQRPAGTGANASLPVLFWIFGGGFELGSPQMYDATDLLLNAVSQDQPFIYVAVNYRVAGFGFMPGAEIMADGSSNLGLLDQRMGLEWVQDNVASFGGDPTKVTIWGESAGAISVFDQMALYDGDNTYNGNPLFRGAIMDSGSIIPADPVNGTKGQAIYDTVVEAAGCSGSNDTLNCLRDLDYDTFLNAANSVPGILSYNSVALSYLPRPDGVYLTDSPDVLAKNGQYAAVPMIIGDQEDEGTIFALFQSNITTEDELVDYLYSYYFYVNADRQDMADLVATYPAKQAAGSPFNTGPLNDAYPEYKRLAAILGDLTFTLTRRVFLEYAAAAYPDVASWSYLASYDYGTPLLGTFHGSDILQVFNGVLPDYASDAIQSYYFAFLYGLDPNGVANSSLAEWPQWADDRQLTQFWSLTSNLLTDDFRSNQSDWITANVDLLHI
ncbi:Alpha/Beta hydrolase protein [Xylariaceae sp. FL0804]|nr:Alpha/Beta hydrolase protein [Xylariaceae sp. FL0804]